MFWTNFVNLCNERNISPNAVCADLKLSKATATHWKNGSIPNGEVLVRLAKYFDTSIDYLMGLSTTVRLELTDLEKEILHILNSVHNLSNKAKLVGYAECYSQKLISDEQIKENLRKTM